MSNPRRELIYGLDCCSGTKLPYRGNQKTESQKKSNP